MAFIYKAINPDISGGTADTTPYQRAFDATTSWGAASGGVYSQTITRAVHGKSVTPIVQVYELDTGNYELVLPNSIDIDTSGNVTITVTENNNTRFEGRIVIL